MKKIISLIFIFNILFLPVFAKNPIKTHALVRTEYDSEDKTTKIIKFIPDKKIKIGEILEIPSNSIINAEIFQPQKEKRFHKSGYMICKLLNYSTAEEDFDISDKEIYVIARKYEELNGKEATIIGLELMGSAFVSFFAPGADIAYFFTKGAITKKKHPNWFKSGVRNAYDNSILWLILKGKTIKLSKNDEINLKYISREDARNTKAKIDYKNFKTAFKQEKKLVRADIKQIKNKLKEEEKLVRLQERSKKVEIKAAGRVLIDEE